jgi:hypothetical protein
MSKLKLRLAGLAFIVLSLLALGSKVVTANDCIDLYVWASDPARTVCYGFANPCSVPQGWTIYTNGCPF